jgi:hypothetical protein
MKSNRVPGMEQLRKNNKDLKMFLGLAVVCLLLLITLNSITASKVQEAVADKIETEAKFSELMLLNETVDEYKDEIITSQLEMIMLIEKNCKNDTDYGIYSAKR